MSMNEGALKSMAGMIQAMLPYELDYLPESIAGQTINEIFYLIREKNPKLDEFKGFMGYVLKKIDGDETVELDVMLMQIWAIINEHYPTKNPKEGFTCNDCNLFKALDEDEKTEQPFVFHPFDRGQYDEDGAKPHVDYETC